MSALRLGASTVAARLGWRRVVPVLVASLGVVVVGGLVGRHAPRNLALDIALGLAFRWVLPFTAIALARIALGPRRLDDEVWAVARFGHPRAAVGLGAALALVLVTALLGGALGVAAVLSSGAPGGSLVGELVTVGWIGALSGAAYGAWFALASCFGRAAGGRGVFLVVDLILGTAGPFGVILPRGLTLGLLALESPLDLPQRAASALLAITGLVALGALALRLGEATRRRDLPA